jgi:hypothetical protein
MAATTRSRQAKEEKKPMAQGVGESRIFGGGDNANPPKDLSGYTCQGQPIPEELWEKFPYSLTDQGKAAAEEEKRKLPVSYARPRPAQELYRGVEDDDKKQVAFRDALELDTDGLTLSVDPLAPLMEQHTPRGHKGIFLSRKQTAEKGLTRGVLTYQPVLIPDGNGGMKEVTCGGLFLASVPEELVRKSDAYYARINQEKQITALDKVQDASDRLMSHREAAGILRRKGASDAGVGLEEEDQETGDQDLLRNAPLVHE